MNRFILSIVPVIVTGCTGGFTSKVSEPVALTSASNVSDISTVPPVKICLNGGDQNTINNALKGDGAVASLCPNSIFALTGPIVFTAPNQEISTQGYPIDASRAVLRVAAADAAQAILGYQSGIKIKYVVVDGNRPQLGYMAGDVALIDIGGAADGQIVDHTKLIEPRGWSALHIREGDVTGGHNCSGAQITNNEIGPAGQPAPFAYWADGISLACTASIVTGNLIVDATDGGIVVFGAPGSVVTNNIIRADTRSLIGGINLVDYAPYAGDYTGVQVKNNTIISTGGFVKVGIDAGPLAGGISPTEVSNGATVVNNTISGPNFGYGLAIAGVRNFYVAGNTVTGGFGGLTADCDRNAPPQVAIIDLATSVGTFAQSFTNSPAKAVLGCTSISNPLAQMDAPVIQRSCDLAALRNAYGTAQDEVAYLYCLAQGRNADASALTSFSSQLSAGTLTSRDLMIQMFRSNEFQLKYAVVQMSNYGYVRFLYRLLQLREADDSGLNTFVPALNSGADRESVFNAIIDSSEFKSKLPPFGSAAL